MFGIANRKSTFVFPDEDKSCPPEIERRFRCVRWIVVLHGLDIRLVFENLCKIVEELGNFPPRLPRIVRLFPIRARCTEKLVHLASKVLNFCQEAPVLVS